MPKYTSETKLETYLNDTIATGAADDAIAAAEKIIDEYTGRNFKADAAASARLFDGDGSQELLIDDCVEITKVEVGSNEYGDSFTEVLATGSARYIKLPANNSALGVPIRKLLSISLLFIEGVQNHRITAKWGYSIAAPADIVMAATILAAFIYTDGRDDGMKSESIGAYSISYLEGNDLADELLKVKKILDNYRKIEL